MKKFFTLIEMLIVVIIVWILAMISLRLWWNYISKIQFKSDKEELLLNYNKTLSQSLSSNNISWQKYNLIWIELVDTSDRFDLYYFSWTDIWKIKSNRLNYSNFKNFKLNWVSISTWYLFFESYKIWCKFQNNSIVDSWSLYFEIYSQSLNYSYCFDLFLNNCKLIEKKC